MCWLSCSGNMPGVNVSIVFLFSYQSSDAKFMYCLLRNVIVGWYKSWQLNGAQKSFLIIKRISFVCSTLQWQCHALQMFCQVSLLCKGILMTPCILYDPISTLFCHWATVIVKRLSWISSDTSVSYDRQHLDIMQHNMIMFVTVTLVTVAMLSRHQVSGAPGVARSVWCSYLQTIPMSRVDTCIHGHIATPCGAVCKKGPGKITQFNNNLIN